MPQDSSKDEESAPKLSGRRKKAAKAKPGSFGTCIRETKSL